ncbi:DUF488 domain-containing protein [Kistimonas scapharcae]|uniref:DUF488 domain-containing protein n=1 Tax=Kistimonas scapharcae TaxID=1036133 RepID=A0ABP8V2X9_9GAMM
MNIALKRVYEESSAADGFRILVERLWPRGISKEKAKIDLWDKDAAPSTELRHWFNHDPEKWEEFKQRYFAELHARVSSLEPIFEHLKKEPVTFVYSSRETRYNNAVALKAFIENQQDRVSYQKG